MWLRNENGGERHVYYLTGTPHIILDKGVFVFVSRLYHSETELPGMLQIYVG